MNLIKSYIKCYVSQYSGKVLIKETTELSEYGLMEVCNHILLNAYNVGWDVHQNYYQDVIKDTTDEIVNYKKKLDDYIQKYNITEVPTFILAKFEEMQAKPSLPRCSLCKNNACKLADYGKDSYYTGNCYACNDVFFSP